MGTHSKSFTHKTINDWIYATVEHRQEVSAEVRQHKCMKSCSCLQINYFLEESYDQKVESDRKPTNSERYDQNR